VRIPSKTILAAALVLCCAIPARAQRDPGDRGLRLEHDELRNDMSYQRLRKPSTPVWLAPSRQDEPVATPNQKSKRTRQR
jgi:hypothetical protein